MQALVLLHGALGAAATLQPLADALSGDFQVHTLDFPGHGGRAFPDAAFSVPLFAEAVLTYLDNTGLERVPVFGYSMGGYVALYLALHHPDRISRVATLATKLDWNGPGAEREAAGLDPERMVQRVPRFAEQLQARHTPQDWRELLARTAAFLRQLGADPALTPAVLARIQQPVLLLRGDRDAMVSLDETVAAFTALPAGALGVLPQTPHPLEKADPAVLASLLRRFLIG